MGGEREGKGWVERGRGKDGWREGGERMGGEREGEGLRTMKECVTVVAKGHARLSHVSPSLLNF